MSDDPLCAKCGHPRSNHHRRHPFVGPSRDDTIREQADRIKELETERDAVAAAYEDAAKVAIDYINGDLAQPEMGIWWNIMKSAQSDTTAALERVRREARNEALEED